MCFSGVNKRMTAFNAIVPLVREQEIACKDEFQGLDGVLCAFYIVSQGGTRSLSDLSFAGVSAVFIV